MNRKLITELQNILRNKADTIPKGWYTMVQLSKQLDRSLTSTKTTVNNLINNYPTRIKVKKFRIVDNSGRVQPIQHYKIK
jgi:hypothetical protein